MLIHFGRLLLHCYIVATSHWCPVTTLHLLLHGRSLTNSPLLADFIKILRIRMKNTNFKVNIFKTIFFCLHCTILYQPHKKGYFLIFCLGIGNALILIAFAANLDWYSHNSHYTELQGTALLFCLHLQSESTDRTRLEQNQRKEMKLTFESHRTSGNQTETENADTRFRHGYIL